MRTITCCVLPMLLFPAVAALAQNINLSGEWYLHKRKSEPTDVDGRRVPTKLVVEQDGGNLAFDRTYDGFFVFDEFTIGGEPSTSTYRNAPRTAEAGHSTLWFALCLSLFLD